MKKRIAVICCVMAMLLGLGTYSHAALIAQYDFSGNANDSSGNGHDGTVVGATLASDRFGNANSAYSFDGNDYITVPDSADFSFGAGDFTIAAWGLMSQYSADGGYYLMGHSEGPGLTDKWIFWFGNDRVSFDTNPTDWVHFLSGSTVGLNTWYHLAVRRSGSELSAFINGSIIGTTSISGAMHDPNAPLLIGTAEFDRPNRQYRGSIDDVRLYNNALTDAELRDLAGVSAVPEPSTLLLLGSGLAGLGLVGWRKRRG